MTLSSESRISRVLEPGSGGNPKSLWLKDLRRLSVTSDRRSELRSWHPGETRVPKGIYANPLLGARTEDRVLGGFGHAELHHALRSDLDRLTGRRVATHASFAVNEHELAQARKGECVLRILVSQVRDEVENLARLLLGDVLVLGDGRRDL